MNILDLGLEPVNFLEPSDDGLSEIIIIISRIYKISRIGDEVSQGQGQDKNGPGR